MVGGDLAGLLRNDCDTEQVDAMARKPSTLSMSLVMSLVVSQ